MSASNAISREAIGKRIAEERSAAGYRQADLASRLGVDATVLSKVEAGRRGLDSLLLRRIATELDVPMDRFFAEGETPTRAMARGASGPEAERMLSWAREVKADMDFVRRESERRYGR